MSTGPRQSLVTALADLARRSPDDPEVLAVVDQIEQIRGGSVAPASSRWQRVANWIGIGVIFGLLATNTATMLGLNPLVELGFIPDRSIPANLETRLATLEAASTSYKTNVSSLDERMTTLESTLLTKADNQALNKIKEVVDQLPPVRDLQFGAELGAHWDLDGDGLSGADDRCPLEMKGPPEYGGCPQPYLVRDDATIKGGDKEKDGVADLFDGCENDGEPGKVVALPNTLDPANHWIWPQEYAKYPTVGCPDDDGDQVRNGNDTCEATAAQVPVDAEGCDQTQAMRKNMKLIEEKIDKSKQTGTPYDVDYSDQTRVDGTTGSVTCTLKNKNEGGAEVVSCRISPV